MSSEALNSLRLLGAILGVKLGELLADAFSWSERSGTAFSPDFPSSSPFAVSQTHAKKRGARGSPKGTF